MDKLDYLEHPIPPAPVPAQAGQQVALEALAAHATWVKGSKEIAGIMLITMELEIQLYLENLSAYEMLQELKTLFAQQADQELLQAVQNYRHWKRNCPQNLAELLKNLKLSHGASISGSKGNGLEIVLNNCHYAPSITRGVISVSRLYEDGFINRFVNNTIQVSRNNMVYFSAIPRDGIFEIDLSNSYANDSSIYTVSNKRAKLDLDSALLWHCRLGHISKKRIEKLQHDGLLNSTDLRAFEKCVSCMSGKMARKPYTHQVERAKDLLGLIHTDVCGPFKIMSRQGASYFVTFTDDFSRYGYVYLLKHKHEVFETFKVFQKEVENQLGKTIKSLCSNREGEYMSQEFLDHLKDYGIIAYRTPPYTPQHNGDLGEPANYKAALLDPEFDKWLNAMNVEMQSMKDNEFVDLGYTQTRGIDYEGTFSPIADIRAIRILIAKVAFYDYEIWQMDVKTAFLNGYLSKEVYMEQPKGFVNPKYPNRVCKLKRSIYGLKQASRQ
ncbi:retrotransposon protein, putative, ty1-copia subclass [Tanacetum coccineum]